MAHPRQRELRARQRRRVARRVNASTRLASARIQSGRATLMQCASARPVRFVLSSATTTPVDEMPSHAAMYSGRLRSSRQTVSPWHRPTARAHAAYWPARAASCAYVKLSPSESSAGASGRAAACSCTTVARMRPGFFAIGAVSSSARDHNFATDGPTPRSWRASTGVSRRSDTLMRLPLRRPSSRCR